LAFLFGPAAKWRSLASRVLGEGGKIGLAKFRR
jgi:hypothetical protein